MADHDDEALTRLREAMTGGEVRVTFGFAFVLSGGPPRQMATIETKHNGRWTKVKPVLVDDSRRAVCNQLALLTQPEKPSSTD